HDIRLRELSNSVIEDERVDSLVRIGQGESERLPERCSRSSAPDVHNEVIAVVQFRVLNYAPAGVVQIRAFGGVRRSLRPNRVNPGLGQDTAGIVNGTLQRADRYFGLVVNVNRDSRLLRRGGEGG